VTFLKLGEQLWQPLCSRFNIVGGQKALSSLDYFWNPVMKKDRSLMAPAIFPRPTDEDHE
jgi:hypothetical protein